MKKEEGIEGRDYFILHDRRASRKMATELLEAAAECSDPEKAAELCEQALRVMREALENERSGKDSRGRTQRVIIRR